MIFFPTPGFATRALCEWLENDLGEPLGVMSCREPACGQGHMARPLAEYFGRVESSDVHNYGFGAVRDFLFPPLMEPADWSITNPPFRVADQFVATMLMTSRRGAAVLVRTAFLESADRYNFLFKETPPAHILQFVERVPMFKGRVDRKGSTATSYCWLVFEKGRLPGAPRFHWIAPCRKRLERDSDYASVGAPS